jgi:hypothetical protein
MVIPKIEIFKNRQSRNLFKEVIFSLPNAYYAKTNKYSTYTNYYFNIFLFVVI